MLLADIRLVLAAFSYLLNCFSTDSIVTLFLPTPITFPFNYHHFQFILIKLFISVYSFQLFQWLQLTLCRFCCLIVASRYQSTMFSIISACGGHFIFLKLTFQYTNRTNYLLLIIIHTSVHTFKNCRNTHLFKFVYTVEK